MPPIFEPASPNTFATLLATLPSSERLISLVLPSWVIACDSWMRLSVVVSKLLSRFTLLVSLSFFASSAFFCAASTFFLAASFASSGASLSSMSSNSDRAMFSSCRAVAYRSLAFSYALQFSARLPNIPLPLMMESLSWSIAVATTFLFSGVACWYSLLFLYEVSLSLVAFSCSVVCRSRLLNTASQSMDFFSSSR